MRQEQPGAMPGVEVFVFSRTLPARAGTGSTSSMTIPATSWRRSKPGRDVTSGSSAAARSAAPSSTSGLVDTAQIALMPVLRGSGVRLVTAGATTRLALADHRTLPDSGIVALSYSVGDRRGGRRDRGC